MFAAVENNKFTGFVVKKVSPQDQAWADTYGIMWVEIDAALENVGTDEQLDYGAPTAEQLDLTKTRAARREELTNLIRTPIDVLTLQSLAARLNALEELLGYRETEQK